MKESGGIVSGNAASGNVVISNGTVRRTMTVTAGIERKETEMSRSELSQRRQRLQRKLAASFEGWHSGRIDRLEEALRAIERELETTTAARGAKHH